MRGKTLGVFGGLLAGLMIAIGACATRPTGGGVTIPPVSFTFNEDEQGNVQGLEFEVTANEPSDISVPNTSSLKVNDTGGMVTPPPVG